MTESVWLFSQSAFELVLSQKKSILSKVNQLNDWIRDEIWRCTQSFLIYSNRYKTKGRKVRKQEDEIKKRMFVFLMFRAEGRIWAAFKDPLQDRKARRGWQKWSEALYCLQGRERRESKPVKREREKRKKEEVTRIGDETMLLLILFRVRRGCEVGKPTNEEYKEIKEEWRCGRGDAELLVERKVLPDHRHGLLSHNPSGRPRLHAHTSWWQICLSAKHCPVLTTWHFNCAD